MGCTISGVTSSFNMAIFGMLGGVQGLCQRSSGSNPVLFEVKLPSFRFSEIEGVVMGNK